MKKLSLIALIVLLSSCSTNKLSSSLANSSTNVASLSTSLESSSIKESSVESSSSKVSSSIISSETSQKEGRYSISVNCPSGVTYSLSHKSADEGESVTLKVQALENYVIDAVLINCQEVSLDGEGKVVFQMPSQDVEIVIYASNGYKVNLDNNENISFEFVSSGNYYASNDVVTINVTNVKEGYYVSRVYVETASSKTYDLEKNVDGSYFFYMPKEEVTVKGEVKEIPSGVSSFVGVYENGYELDSNVEASGYKLVIDYDKVELFLDWQDPYFYGAYEINDGVLTANLIHNGSTYKFTVEFSEDNNYLMTTFYFSSTSFDYYLFSRNELNLENIYLNYSNTSGKRERLYRFTSGSEVFFTYVPIREDRCYFHLDAYDFDGQKVSDLTANNVYSFKNGDLEVLAVHYDGSYITLSGNERGEYSQEGSYDLFLDGFNKARYKGNVGSYSFDKIANIALLNINEEEIKVKLNLDSKTYEVINPLENVNNFASSRYEASFRVFDDDWNSYDYIMYVNFAAANNVISSLGITCDWTAPGVPTQEYTNATYDFNEETMILNVTYSYVSYGNEYSKTLEFKVNSNYSSITLNGMFGYISETKNIILRKV